MLNFQVGKTIARIAQHAAGLSRRPEPAPAPTSSL
jgi:hypothetical protein